MGSGWQTVRALVAECEAVLAGAAPARGESGEPFDGRREARALVADVAGESRTWPATMPLATLSPAISARVRAAARRRAKGEPFEYCVGLAPFRHLVLGVDRRVLIPRPETEMLVELVLQRVDQSSPDVGVAIDVGTGSGAIALALASEGRFSRVIGTDLSADALVVARENAVRCAALLRAPVEFREGAGLAPVQGERAIVVVSNPPYIARSETEIVAAGVRDWEPDMALFAEADGMAVIAAIVAGGANVLDPGGLLALEVDTRRADRALQLVRDDARYANAEIVRDLTGRDRFVLAVRAAAHGTRG